MVVPMLMLSLIAALVGGIAAWAAAGFWWGLLAYAATGAIVLLLLGILIAIQPSREARQPSGLAEPEVTG